MRGTARSGATGRLLRIAVLLTCATVLSGAGWSTASTIPLGSGTWSAPGGVSAGLQLWLDAGEPLTLHPATQGRIWFDKSLLERDGRPVSSAVAPSMGASGGFAEVAFSNSALSLPSSIAFEPMTLAIVMRIDSSSGTYPILGSRTRGTGIAVGYSKVRAYVNDVLAATPLFTPSSGRILVLFRAAAGGSDYANINGGSDLAMSFTSTEPLNQVGGIYLGGAPRYLSAGISELAVWNRVLSSAERAAVTRALGAKWGISVP